MMQGALAKYESRDGHLTVDTGVTGSLDTNGDIAVVDCRDMINVVANVNCVHAGTGHCFLEGTWDGTNWKSLANEYDVSGATFVAGAVAEQVALSDGNGMPTPVRAIRLRASQAFGGGAIVSLTVAGLKTLS